MKTNDTTKNGGDMKPEKTPKSHKDSVDLLVAARCNAASSMKQGVKKQLSDRLGVSQSTVSGYLNGDTKVPVALVVEVAEITGVSIDWLLTGNGPGPAIDRTKLSPTEQVLIKPAGSRPVYSSTALPWNNETAEYVAESSWPQNTTAMIRFISASLPFLCEDQITALFSEIKGFMLESQAEEKTSGRSE